ncbi:MAG: hypothetical protein NT166_22860 [Candidatus Aminicenantes bacterium]|nr:hypothetical protein [Candidatus Aminicenantes bacterium]
MTTLEAFELKLPIIKAIPARQIKMSHNMPIETYLQEAENLYNWCQADQVELTGVKLSWDLVLDLPVRCGALREAESRWQKKYLSEEAAEKAWMEKAPLAYALRNDLLDHFRFAFRHDEKLAKKVRKIAAGRTHADMIQDLNDLSVLGKGYPEYLEAINFDMPLLDKAALWSGEMAALLAVVVGDRAAASAAKKLRDQAYTHLKEAVDELYGYGQYVFRDSEERRKRYCSEFLQRLRAKNPTTPAPSTAAAPTAPKTDETQTPAATEQKQS